MSATATKVEVRERPIIFSGPMINAILEGRKTQTRRVVKAQLDDGLRFAHEDGGGNWIFWSGPCAPNMAEFTKKAYPNGEGIPCPYGRVGDRLWVREAWYCAGEHECDGYPVRYKTDADLASYVSTTWRTPIFMPRWASRITLEITNVRVERLQEISEDDCWHEGVSLARDINGITYQMKFQQGWDAINGKRKACDWASNPFVWVLEFHKL